LAVWASVDALRARVNARIRAALSGETGEIAVALITGERGGISEELNQAMRDSGLAHILSIFGLHMVIMGLSDVSLVWATLRKGWGLVMGAAVTTLVASAAIAPFAVYHFHRMTHYGLVANMIAAPLVSLLIMPMAVLSLIAMPFGLEVWPLKAMGFGIELMVKAGVWVAGWPGAVTVLPASAIRTAFVLRPRL
jgi:predicted membrane metal-binding protein